LQNLHLLSVDRPDTEHPRGLLRLTVQAERAVVAACRDCGVVADLALATPSAHDPGQSQTFARTPSHQGKPVCRR